MTPDPQVTAIITTYNSEAHVLRALESVRRQTRPVDEIIVVDDGSTDATCDLVRDLADVRLVTQRNAGPGASRNTGIKASNGSLIAFLDADDMWLPDKTRRQVDHLRQHSGDVAVSGGKIWWNEVEDSRRSHDYEPRFRRDIARHLPHINCVGNPSMVMMRRDGLERVGGFNASIRWGQDWDLWVRLLQHGGIGFLSEDVIVYSWRPGNHSHADPEARLQSFYRVSRSGIATLFPWHRKPGGYLKAFSSLCSDRAALARIRGERLRALRLSTCALVCFPFWRASENAKLLMRASLGEGNYQRLRQLKNDDGT